jgi:hypothetical protein
MIKNYWVVEYINLYIFGYKIYYFYRFIYSILQLLIFYLKL